MRAFVLILLSVFVCQAAFAQINQVKVTGGEVRGVSEGEIMTFKGIPFAAPPVGDLRWRSPQPVQPWREVITADHFGDGCMQNVNAPGGDGANPTSEDCLYLNVWTPARSSSEQRPVLVWIYGGGFTFGRTSTPMYNGVHFAEKGVVTVSIGYRVGPMGFMAHEALSRESGRGSGTYGLQDMIAGLEWVRDNIAVFGGDPSRVTIFGHSAGGFAVSMLAASPRARGLFHGVISMSGGSFAPLKQAGDEAGMRVPALDLAERTGEQFLQRLGVRDIAAARKLDPWKVQEGFADSGLSFQPVADGYVITGDQYVTYQQGKFNDTPVLIGSTSDEAASLGTVRKPTNEWVDSVISDYGPAAEKLLAAYPHDNDQDTYRGIKGILRETLFAWPTWSWARLQTSEGTGKSFVYFYDNHPADTDGAGHGSDVPFAFQTLNVRPNPSAEDWALSDMISSYFVNFVIHGDPNGAGLPLWPAFNTTSQQAMVFDQAPGARTLPNLDKLEAFDTYYAWRREQAEGR